MYKDHLPNLKVNIPLVLFGIERLGAELEQKPYNHAPSERFHSLVNQRKAEGETESALMSTGRSNTSAEYLGFPAVIGEKRCLLN